jgi:hypothetical protein
MKLRKMDHRPNKRRRHERVPKTIPAMITVGHHTVAATTKDLSVGGMFLFADVLLRQGADLDIVLMLPKEVETSHGQCGVAAQIEQIAHLRWRESLVHRHHT